MAEYGDIDTIFNHPLHPYTCRLIEAFPDVNAPLATLASIPGHPPPLSALPPGCRFEPRCAYRTALCAVVAPAERQLKPGHVFACHNVEAIEAIPEISS